jgi:hypothetical protein
MGIKVELDPDLALRNYEEFENGNRKIEECIPKVLEAGKSYNFLKKGFRVYWLSDDSEWSKGEMPLCITTGDEKLSKPIASIKMIEETHFLLNGEPYTKGIYKVIEVFNPDDPTIKFESYKRIK